MATPTAVPTGELPELPGLTVPNLNGTAAGVKLTPRTHTTRRAFATASLCLGLWGALTFWMYPFGLMICVAAVTMGVISVLFGIRAGLEGQHLAWTGIVFGSVGIGAAFTIYRFYQAAFEGINNVPIANPFAS